jgi:uncharacterized protein (TIGR02270 family)
VLAEPLWDIVEEHLEEAEFLWGVWERSLVAPNYDLDAVAELVESRLAAHLDGLVLAGELVLPRLLVPALAAAGHDRACAAAAALLQMPGHGGTHVVFEALRELPGRRPALVRALACADRPDLRPRLRGLLAEFDEGMVAAAAEVLRFHHEPLGEAVSVLLAGDDPAARALGLRALPGEPSSSQHLRALHAGLADPDNIVVDAAIEAGLFLASSAARKRARERAQEVDGDRAMLQLALLDEPDARSFLLAAVRQPALRRAALVALSYTGASDVVDACFDWLDEPEAGRLIGEMLSSMTGVDLEDAELSLPDDDDEQLERAPEDELPRPDPMLVSRWWYQQRSQYRDGRRYLGGRPRSPEAVLDALAHGPMRRRPALFLDLQLHARHGAHLRLQPLAPTARQKLEVAGLRSALTAARSVQGG